MDDKVALIYGASKRQSIKTVHDQIVNFFVKLAEHFLSKIEKRGHRATLMIASEQEYTRRVIDLKCKESEHDLHTEHAPVNVVAHEDHTVLAWVLNSVQQLRKVVKLPMYVSNQCAIILNVAQVWLSSEDLKCRSDDFHGVLLRDDTFLVQVVHQNAPVWSLRVRVWVEDRFGKRVGWRWREVCNLAFV